VSIPFRQFVGLKTHVSPSGVSADGEFDAAEIDKELISARLKHDVMEHSGKVHLFIAESVRFPDCFNFTFSSS